MPAFSEEELNKLISMLEALVEDRTLLAAVSTERRIALLQAAGRVSRPTRSEQQRSTRIYRRGPADLRSQVRGCATVLYRW